jgi:hypothetical protein
LSQEATREVQLLGNAMAADDDFAGMRNSRKLFKEAFLKPTTNLRYITS